MAFVQKMEELRSPKITFVQKMEELRSPNIVDDDFINDNVFGEKAKDQSLETMKWKELPTWVIYKILEVVEVDGKFGKSKILTLKSREGEMVRVWACSGLNREKEPLKEAFLRSTGLKVSKKTNQEYFSYDLVRN